MNKDTSGHNFFFWGIAALVWQAIFFYTPLFFFIGISFVKRVSDVGEWYGTFDYYRVVFNPMYLHIIARSFGLALVTVGVCLVISYPVAYYLALYMRKYRALWLALFIFPFWTNLLLLVYAWYFLLGQDGIVNTLLVKIGIVDAPIYLMNSSSAVYCGMFYCYLPFMLLPLYSVFEKLDIKLLDASYDLGANYWQTFTRIIWPSSLPGVKSGAMLVFVPAFGEFVIPTLLGGDKNMYVGSVITHYFLIARNISIGSAFTCVCCAVLAAVLVCLTGGVQLLKKREMRL